ncbi:galactose oxidase early set domain-containing protein [Actinomycetospora aeridis]|uniref:Galactose oxidase early set domain-containing protein n=1 Tax=Actinomycetospora aeridis TaxID=3129231 RepID=A0ABU8NAJ7_9PSEU
MIGQGLTRRVKRFLLLVIVPAVMLGVNVPPAWAWISELRHQRLINSQEYKEQFGKWDVVELPDEQKVNAIHAAVLPTGRILLIAGSGNKEDMFNAGTFKSLVYDPATGRSRVVPTPDDMFCSGHTFLASGNLLVAGGTQRYERLDGAVTNAGGGVIVKNEDPDAAPLSLPAGTEFRTPEGLVYRATHPFVVEPATKVATRRGATVTASETTVFAEAVEPGPGYVFEGPRQYAVGGVPAADAQNIYALGQAMTLKKQNYQGIEQTYEFNPYTEAYERVGDMVFKRWYPTLTGLADGGVIAVSGLDGTGEVLNGQNEVYDPVTRTWNERKDLTQYFPTYPALFQTARDDFLFYSGANSGYGPAEAGRVPGFWNLRTNVITPIPGMRDPDLLETAGSAWAGPVQDQRIAVVGGGGVGESPRSTARIDTIDLDSPNPTWQPGPMLPEGTRYPNLTTLPDDSMLISNGSRDYRGKGDTNNHNARIYRPQTNTLDYAADPAVGRNYHSASMLLPDGRVMVVGSDPLFNDQANTIPGTFEQRIEIYTPPYLFRGPQPTIADAPPRAELGDTVAVATPDAARIQSARLMAPMASTHVTDTHQRSIALDMTKSGAGVSVTLPRDRAIAPPGRYMLFLLDDRGVPSVGRWIEVPEPGRAEAA